MTPTGQSQKRAFTRAEIVSALSVNTLFVESNASTTPKRPANSWRPPSFTHWRHWRRRQTHWRHWRRRQNRAVCTRWLVGVRAWTLPAAWVKTPISQESQREDSERRMESGRMLSVESGWTVFKRRLLQFQPREVIVDNEHTRLHLLQRRRHRLTEESHRKALAQGVGSPSVRKGQKAWQKLSQRDLYESVMQSLAPSRMSKFTSLNRNANSATSVCSDTLRLMASPVTSHSESPAGHCFQGPLWGVRNQERL